MILIRYCLQLLLDFFDDKFDNFFSDVDFRHHLQTFPSRLAVYVDDTRSSWSLQNVYACDFASDCLGGFYGEFFKFVADLCGRGFGSLAVVGFPALCYAAHRGDDLIAEYEGSDVAGSVGDKFLHVYDAMVEGDGFKDGVGDVDVVHACGALSAAAEDWFDDDVTAEFLEGFEGFVDAFGGECAGDGDADVFEKCEDVVFVDAVFDCRWGVNHVETLALKFIEHVHAENKFLKASPSDRTDNQRV